MLAWIFGLRPKTLRIRASDLGPQRALVLETEVEEEPEPAVARPVPA